MCRQATLEDVPFIVEQARKFHSFSPYKNVPFDQEYIETFVIHIIQTGGVFVNESGFILGQMVPLYFSPKSKIAAELAWWCPDGNGRELKDAFEKWGLDNGAEAVQFSTLNNEYINSLAKYLIDDGYKPIEVAYIKGFKN